MSKTIARLLGESEIEIAKIITKLEELSGYNSEDVRLLADMRQRGRRKLSELGLDPDDSQGQEIYHALRAKFEHDNQAFSSAFNFKDEGPDKFNNQLISTLESAVFPKQVYCLKHSAAKDLLRKNPPRSIMKQLGYRSVASMLKREDIFEIYAALPLCESETWLNKYWKQHEKLKAADFETRDIKFIAMPQNRWQDIAGSQGFSSCVLQMGAVAVWPVRKSIRNYGFSLLLLLYEAVEITRSYSASLKLQRMSPDFGKCVARLMRPQIHSPLLIEGSPVPWRVLHGHNDFLRSAWEHLDRLDFKHHSGSKLLAALNPAFAWWADADGLAILDKDKPVSLNLSDNLVNNLKSQPYKSRISQRFEKTFYSELLSRYLKHESVQNYLLSQLDNPAAESETISVRANKYASLARG
jgi:hypothetical protein